MTDPGLGTGNIDILVVSAVFKQRGHRNSLFQSLKMRKNRRKNWRTKS